MAKCGAFCGEKTMWIIRPLTIEDYEGIFKLWSGSTGMCLRAADDSREGITKFLERNPRTCFVAEVSGAADGTAIAGVILGGHDGRRGCIYHAAVLESLRGRGIGQALVAAVEKALDGEGIAKIALVALKDNDAGNRFWEQMGYAARGDLAYRDKTLNADCDCGGTPCS
jgi:ribosomal protein S18 acetylase RimI-like enzyme